MAPRIAAVKSLPGKRMSSVNPPNVILPIYVILLKWRMPIGEGLRSAVTFCRVGILLAQEHLWKLRPAHLLIGTRDFTGPTFTWGAPSSMFMRAFPVRTAADWA